MNSALAREAISFNAQTARRSVPKSVSVEVKQQAEITRDVALQASTDERLFSGVAVEKTENGERPVAKAKVMGTLLGPSLDARTDDQGQFEFMRRPGDIHVYAYSAEKGLAAFATVSSDADSGKIVISKAASVSGRVVDADGRPQRRHRVTVMVRLTADPLDLGIDRVDINLVCDDQGGFNFRGAPAGCEGEVSASHDEDAGFRGSRARSVLAFDVAELAPVELPDLVIPAQTDAQ